MRGSQARRAVLGALVCAVLVLTVGASPAMAGDDLGDAPMPSLGAIALGEQLEVTLDPATGALMIEAGVAGLPVVWDARLAGVDRFGLGKGWAIGGVRFLDVEGGVRMFAGRGEVYEADASAPSGLHGYPDDDLVFARAPGTLPGRTDALLGERDYAFTLTVLGGTRLYFSAAGDQVSSIDRFGQRDDWEWADGHRLTRVIDREGVVAALDWHGGSRVRVTRTAGLATRSDRTVLRGSIERSPTRDSVAAVVDADGARTEFGFGDAGLVRAIRGAAGAVGEIGWQLVADGGHAVEHVRVRDESTGGPLGERRWAVRSGSVSGWPGRAPERDGTSTAGARRTELADGAARVVGEYDQRGRLTSTTLEAATAGGDLVLQEERLEYPEIDAAHPDRLTVTHRDPGTGAARTVEERYAFDARGRLTERTSVDGSVTATRYDDSIGAAGVPNGLLASERRRTADGLVAETRHDANAEHTAVIATESFAGPAERPQRVAREERSIGADGHVTEVRAFAQGGGGSPRVTRWQRRPDAATGVVTVVKTVAATSAIAVTTTEVVDVVLEEPVTSIDATGRVTTITYDEAGRPVRRVSPGGLVATTAYRAGPRGGLAAVTETGADGVAVTEERDGLGRVVRVTDTLATVGDAGAVPVPGHVRVRETRAYPEPGAVEVTDAWGATSRRRSDVLGRVVEATAPSGLAEVTRYDDVRHTRTTGLTPTGNLADAETITVEQLDVLGEVVSTSGQRSDGRPVPATSVTVDGLGRIRSAAVAATETAVEVDAYGNPWRESIRPRGDPGTDNEGSRASGDGDTAVIEARRRFDEFGTSVEKVMSDGCLSRSGGSRTIDELGRTSTVTDPRGRTTTYTYAPDGLVSRIVEGAGRTTEHEYDPETRLLRSTRITSPLGAAVHTAYEHDPATGAVTATFDPRDRPGTVIALTYDGHGNVTSVTYPDGRRIRHTYDEHGRTRTTTDVAGATTTFAYDRVGALAEAVQVDRRGRELARVAYVMDAYGRTTRLVHGNGVVSHFTFTSASELATETTTGPDGAVQAKREYDYDARGNLTLRVDAVAPPNRASATSELEPTTTTYRYDVHDRLIRSAVHDGADADAPRIRESEYDLTGAGDIAAEVVTQHPGRGDARQTVRRFDYDAAGALVAVTTAGADGPGLRSLSYDASGSLRRSSDGRRIEYDAAGRPVERVAADGSSTRMTYWASGRPRATTRAGGDAAGTVVRYWDGPTHVNDAHPDAGGIASYLLGTARHARSVQFDDPRVPASTSYAGLDRHGNVTASSDETGTVTAVNSYADYGSPSGRSGRDPARGALAATATTVADELRRNPFGFASEYTDLEGTQFLAERTYDPVLMAFTSPDRAERHNRYNFADLNPITNVDPTGQTPQVDGGAVLAGLGIAGAVIGFISSVATGGAVLPLIGNGLVGLFDVSVAIAMEVGRTHPSAMAEPTKLTLGGVAFVAGLAAVVAPWFFGGILTGKTSVGKLGDLTDEQWIALRDYDRVADLLGPPGELRRLRTMFPELDEIRASIRREDPIITKVPRAGLRVTMGALTSLEPSLKTLHQLVRMKFPYTAHAVAKIWRVGVTDDRRNGRFVLPSDVTNRIIAYANDSQAYVKSSGVIAELFRDDIKRLWSFDPGHSAMVSALLHNVLVAHRELRAAGLAW